MTTPVPVSVLLAGKTGFFLYTMRCIWTKDVMDKRLTRQRTYQTKDLKDNKTYQTKDPNTGCVT